MEKYKSEILKAEQDFAIMATEKGVEHAFLCFAADDGILIRNNSIIKGKQAIKEYFEIQNFKDFKLNWKPDFVDVSISGDFGYTYGKFSMFAINSEGKEISKEGIFHTIWKRQKDGTWKFVCD